MLPTTHNANQSVLTLQHKRLVISQLYTYLSINQIATQSRFEIWR